MSDPLTTTEVYVQAVEDHLNGTPHVRHPVQFGEIGGGTHACLFCGAVVPQSNHDLHRGWHDRHNAEHARIMREATSYREPPRYGGAR